MYCPLCHMRAVDVPTYETLSTLLSALVRMYSETAHFIATQHLCDTQNVVRLQHAIPTEEQIRIQCEFLSAFIV